ncbi:MAG: gliding motility protein GldN [Bacteroidota bacterium]
MKRTFLICLGFLGAALAPSVTLAKIPSTAVNPNSLKPIPESEILMRKKVWREIDFLVKPNKPFFAYQKEITKSIIEGVQAGQLTPYKDEEFLDPMTQGEFLENLKLPEGDAQTFTADDDDDWGEDSPQKDGPKEEASDSFLPNEVSIIEIMEHWIFDKVRSQQDYDIQYFKLIIPASKFETGLRRVVGIFKYKDLAHYFDEHKVFWVNVDNSAGHLTMTTAFEKRLFLSRITKVENPDNLALADIYKTPKAEAKASQRIEEELLEKEYFLWAP